MTIDADVANILTHCKTIAVVGLSAKPERASFDVARYMQTQGYRIVPVNPNAGVAQILGETVYASLEEAAKNQPTDQPIDPQASRTGLAVRAGGKQLLSLGAGTTLRAWDVNSGDNVLQLENSEALRAFAVSSRLPP